jgi:hypothetical protein
MQFAVMRQPFDGHYLPAVGLHREKRARFDRAAVQQHGARAATGGIAAKMRAGLSSMVADEMHQQQSGIDIGFFFDAVQLDANVMFGHAYPLSVVYN